MLVNAPLVDQLADTVPGDPNDENARANCVPASLASGLMALLPGQTFYADELKDAAYGEAYGGATDPAHFVAVCAAHGVTLAETPGTDPYALLRLAVAALDRHQPATLAIPSEWGIQDWAYVQAHNSPTHEVLLCDWDGTSLTAMNPWPVDGAHAFYQTMPLAWWASRLCYNRVFTMARQNVTYVTNPDGSITYPNGITLHTATAAFVINQHVSGEPLMEQTYFDPNFGVTPFDDGTVLTYDKQRGQIRTDYAGVTIAELAHALAAATAHPGGGDDEAAEAAAIQTAISQLEHALTDQPAPASAPASAPAPASGEGEDQAPAAAPASAPIDPGVDHITHVTEG